MNEIGKKISLSRFQKTLFPLSFQFHEEKSFSLNTEKNGKSLKFLAQGQQSTFQKQKRRKTIQKFKTITPKKMWFFHTAAPIPGVSFLKKQKKVFAEKQNALKFFQTFLGISTKKRTTRIFSTATLTQKKTNFSKNWRLFVWLDSFLHRSLRKTGFAYNATGRKRFFPNFSVNGKFRKKKNFKLVRSERRMGRPADFYSCLNTKISPIFQSLSKLKFFQKGNIFLKKGEKLYLFFHVP